MGIKKRLLAMGIAATTLLGTLTACGAQEAAPASGGSATEATTEKAETGSAETTTEAAPEGDAAQAAIDARKAAAQESGEYQKVVVSFFDWTGAPAGIDRVNEAISEHTRETLGLDVELLIIDSAAYTDDIKLMLSSGEQVDLFSTCGPGYMTCVNNGYTADLEENDLLATYGKELNELIRPDYLDACRVGGKLYGVPPIKDYAIQTACILIGKEYLDGAGYDLSKFKTDDLGYYKATWDDVDDMFAAIHEAFPDKTVYSTQDNLLTQGSCVDNIAGDYFGTLLDPANSLKIENVYESDLFKEWADRAYRWNQAGYISGDAMSDKTGASARIKSGAYMAMMAQAKPAYQNQINGECGRDMVIFDVGDSFMSSSAVSAFPWCMNQATEDPVAAMQVLNALYTDPVVANLVCWGQEGVEYKVNADTSINWADGVNADNSEYYPNVLWMMPNQYAAHVWEGDPIDVGEQTAKFNDNCPVKSKALGFTWDNSDYVSEFTALKNAYEEFGPQVVYGFVDPETGLKQLNDALKAAGLEEYMTAKQAALDAWASENGIN
ncbi:ABC transporter substrate-binding protein [Butyrivibrio sp. AE2032]|uniref:ABC transporter substrate-binding protein n=1 Tax=Butyrivibrio sp. AE2032 TaxID=1458463 RepID=UPI0005576377|nr:ABC transporter substrate-binding protein [Butyrivibrio sp. AE2032]